MMFSGKQSNRAQTGSTKSTPESRIQEHLSSSEHAIDNLEFTKAEKLLECAIEEADRLPAQNHPFRTMTRKALADLAILQNDYIRAEEILGKVIQIIAALPEGLTRNQQLSVHLMHKADLFNVMGRPTEAQSLWKNAIDIIADDPAGMCSAYMGIARSGYAAGDMPQYAANMCLATSQINKTQTLAEQYEVLSALRHGAIKEAENGRFSEASYILEVVLQGLDALAQTDSEDLSTTRLLAATLSERAGRFDLSLRLRRKLVLETIQTKGEVSPETIFLQNGVAQLLCEQGQFEAAEVLLEKNYALATQFGDTAAIVQAGLDLVTAYREQGLYRESAALVTAIAKEHQNSLDTFSAITLIQTQAACRADYGEFETAAQLIDSALERSNEINGIHGLRAQATLHAIRASILADYDREKAAESLASLEDTLQHIPPGQEPLSLNEIRILGARINDDEYNSTSAIKAAKQELKDLTGQFGVTKSLRRADILLILARLERQEDPTAALETLEQARALLEERKRTTTILYGAVLRELSELLPSGEPRASEYERIAERLLNKIPKNNVENPDTENPFNTDQEGLP